MQHLYWIRYSHHTDPFTEGYIGISSQPQKRFKYHKAGKNGDNPSLYKAILKGAELQILHTTESREDILLIEEKYRPVANVGWNIIPGGITPPNQTGKKFDSKNHGMRNKYHSAETKQFISEYFKQMKWFNNGEKNIRTHQCPTGFVPGRLPHEYNLSDQGKKNLGKSGKNITTPYGTFDTIQEAADQLDMTWDQVSWRVRKDKYKEWDFC